MEPENLVWAFSIDKLPRQKSYERIKQKEMNNKPLPKKSTIYLKDDNYQPVEFKGGTTKFTSNKSSAGILQVPLILKFWRPKAL